ncbi:hypothetical protein B0H63DRAFT_529595 [Podospora didyma]|uniref:Uncharacterized protein n=1 Tax=Podospora didyma TaxID=330526 RepID=A0AAE0N3B9_9PEZI|nr:hypothetical protein B0H63DRAFT_529595 [Podospora didyma]
MSAREPREGGGASVNVGAGVDVATVMSGVADASVNANGSISSTDSDLPAENLTEQAAVLPAYFRKTSAAQQEGQLTDPGGFGIVYRLVHPNLKLHGSVVKFVICSDSPTVDSNLAELGAALLGHQILLFFMIPELAKALGVDNSSAANVMEASATIVGYKEILDYIHQKSNELKNMDGCNVEVMYMWTPGHKDGNSSYYTINGGERKDIPKELNILHLINHTFVAAKQKVAKDQAIAEAAHSAKEAMEQARADAKLAKLANKVLDPNNGGNDNSHKEASLADDQL